jgi:hypothetical protein
MGVIVNSANVIMCHCTHRLQIIYCWVVQERSCVEICLIPSVRMITLNAELYLTWAQTRALYQCTVVLFPSNKVRKL